MHEYCGFLTFKTYFNANNYENLMFKNTNAIGYSYANVCKWSIIYVILQNV